MNQALDMSAVRIDHITKTLPRRWSERMSFSLCYSWNSNAMLYLTEHPLHKQSPTLYKACYTMDFKQSYGFYHLTPAHLCRGNCCKIIASFSPDQYVKFMLNYAPQTPVNILIWQKPRKEQTHTLISKTNNQMSYILVCNSIPQCRQMHCIKECAPSLCLFCIPYA